MDVRDQELADLVRQLLDEVRAMRTENERIARLLEQMLEKLSSLERSQYG